MSDVKREAISAWEADEMARSKARQIATSRITAADILKSGLGHMEDRAATYDSEQGERSMAKTVEIFNTLTNNALSEEEGWLMMVCLKMVRSQQGALRMDSYEDGAAYFALAGESAKGERDAE